MATMEIGGWSTTCSVCRRGTDWDEEGHLTIRGYGKDNGQPGCGTKWDRMVFTVGLGPNSDGDWLKIMNEEDDIFGGKRYAQWMIDLYTLTVAQDNDKVNLAL